MTGDAPGMSATGKMWQLLIFTPSSLDPSTLHAFSGQMNMEANLDFTLFSFLLGLRFQRFSRHNRDARNTSHRVRRAALDPKHQAKALLKFHSASFVKLKKTSDALGQIKQVII